MGGGSSKQESGGLGADGPRDPAETRNAHDDDAEGGAGGKRHRASMYTDRKVDETLLSERTTDGPHLLEEGGAHVTTEELTNTSDAVVKARQSCALPAETVKAALSVAADYDDVLQACIRNAKIGPFTATSGVVLPFYLNAGTNFLDKTIAPAITRMSLDVLAQQLAGKFTEDDRVLIAGMETAGGMMVSQFSAVAAVTHPDFAKLCDFVYCRKRKKGSGTCQQLEGPQFITDRTADSPPLKCVWLDDANSTGSSLRDGVLLLKRDYNIIVETALYLVDRAADRKTLPPTKIGLADPAVQGVNVIALYDLEQVAIAITEKMAAPE